MYEKWYSLWYSSLCSKRETAALAKVCKQLHTLRKKSTTDTSVGIIVNHNQVTDQPYRRYWSTLGDIGRY